MGYHWISDVTNRISQFLMIANSNKLRVSDCALAGKFINNKLCYVCTCVTVSVSYTSYSKSVPLIEICYGKQNLNS